MKSRTLSFMLATVPIVVASSSSGTVTNMQPSWRSHYATQPIATVIDPANVFTNYWSNRLADTDGFWDPIFGAAAMTLWNPSGASASFGAGPDGALYALTVGRDYPKRSIDRTNWVPMGSSLNGKGQWEAIAFANTNIYIGGLSLGTCNVIRWDGSDWQPAGDTLNGRVRALAVVGQDLLAGGDFFSGDGTDINQVQHIARLDANGHWTRIGNGITNGSVYAIAGVGDEIFIGGSFTKDGGCADYIARLNGDSWTNLAEGVSGTSAAGTVTALAACGTNLFVGGYFTVAGTKDGANGVAIWNTCSWRILGGGIQAILDEIENVTYPHVLALSVRGDRLFVAGRFNNIGNGSILRPASNLAVAVWSESDQSWAWSDLDFGVTHQTEPYPLVRRIVTVPGTNDTSYDVYVAGDFNLAGQAKIRSEGVACWRVGRPFPAGPPRVLELLNSM